MGWVWFGYVCDFLKFVCSAVGILRVLMKGRSKFRL